VLRAQSEPHLPLPLPEKPVRIKPTHRRVQPTSKPTNGRVPNVGEVG